MKRRARRPLPWLGAALLVCVESAPVRSSAGEDVSKGMEQVAAGRYQEAVTTLTAVAAGLPEWNGKRDPKAATVFLHLGLAYAGLGDAPAATAQFLLALTRDPKIAPDARKTPPAGLELFRAARKDAEAKGLLPGQPERRGSPKVALALAAGGTALVAGAAMALDAGSEGQPAGSAPMIANLVVGDVQAVDAVRGIVPLEFDFTDPDGDIARCSVRIGDGGSASNALPDAAGQTAGRARVFQSFDLPPRGVTLGIVVRVVDSRGSPSNELHGALLRR